MRFIRKGAEPLELRRWKDGNPSSSGREAFKTLSPEAKQALRDQMLREQGRLCAYTMMRIGGDERVHIEHIKPQARHPGLALAYENMVACATGNASLTYPFGAAAKGGADVSDANFVSPLHRSCERRFRYDTDGKVYASSTADVAAEQTIQLLALNDRYLVASRRRAIDAQIMGVGGRKAASIAEAKRLSNSVLEPDASGQLPPFCVALHQIAVQIAERRKRRAQRLARRTDR